MKNNKKNKIVLIYPAFYYHMFDSSPAIAYLRGFLEKKKIKSESINFNKLLHHIENDSSKSLNRFKEYLLINIKKRGKILSKKNSLLEILNNFISFCPDKIWDAVDKFDFCDDVILDSLLKNKKRYNYIGISLLMRSQLIFSLRLSKITKNFSKRKIRIVWGGPFVTTQYKDLIELLSQNPIVDYLIIGQGETSLYKLLTLKNKNAVPNLIYYKKKSYNFSKTIDYEENINLLPSPLFEEEDLLTIQASRKCYWGNCAFCSHDYANLCKKVVIRPAKDVIKDVKVINNSILNARKFYFFSDSAIPISFLKEFTKGILKENIEISFSGYFRLDSKLNYSILKKAKQAKLKTLIFGLETLNFRLLKLINKNYNTKDALKIIKICSDLKFNRIFLTFMLGMPTQTKKELENDLNKLFKIVYNFNNITVYAHLFTLMENTMIYNKPEDFDIKLFIKKRKFLSPSVPFKQLRKNSISSDMAINIVKECYNKHRLKSHINMHFDSSGDISHYMITKKS